MTGDAQAGLLDALIARAGGEGTIVSAKRRDWASCTFEGERHEIALDMPDAAGAAFARDIGEAEFLLDGHFVASIAIVGATANGARSTVAVEALTMVLA